MSKLSLLERYYMVWRTKQLDAKSFLMNLEAKIQELDERLSKLEAENQELKKQLRENDSLDYLEKIWIKIRDYAIENKTSILLNPSREYRFNIVEVDKDFIRVDKLGKIKLTKHLFTSIIEMLKEKGGWIRIGASVKNTKPNTVEGYIKTQFFKGDMNGPMTAPWVSAILTRSNVGIIFNNKAIGQALKFNG